jgi:hypothetical protein
MVLLRGTGCRSRRGHVGGTHVRHVVVGTPRHTGHASWPLRRARYIKCRRGCTLERAGAGPYEYWQAQRESTGHEDLGARERPRQR